MNFIQKYIYKRNLKQKEKIFLELVFKETHDEYIDWNERYISFFDYEYIEFTDYNNPFLDIVGYSGNKYYLFQKIPISDILSHKLLLELKSLIRLKKLAIIM